MSRAIQDLKAAIALTRFGLGARPGELQSAALDAEAWLEDQIVGSGGDLSLADSSLSRQRLLALVQNQAEEKAIQTSGLKPEQAAEKLGHEKSIKSRLDKLRAKRSQSARSRQDRLAGSGRFDS